MIFENIITASENYKAVLDQVKQVTPTNTTVLIMGETGTGKELLARAVHKASKRNQRSGRDNMYDQSKKDGGILIVHQSNGPVIASFEQ